MSERKAPTISISLTDATREKLDYIQEALGVHSRSAAVAVCISEVHDRLQEQGYSRLRREQSIDIDK